SAASSPAGPGPTGGITGGTGGMGGAAGSEGTGGGGNASASVPGGNGGGFDCGVCRRNFTGVPSAGGKVAPGAEPEAPASASPPSPPWLSSTKRGLARRRGLGAGDASGEVSP